MSDNSADKSWLDEVDPDADPNLTCHVELSIETGDTFREQHAKVAWALRTIAVHLEAGNYDTGFHPIITLNGEKLGELYLSYDGMMKP